MRTVSGNYVRNPVQPKKSKIRWYLLANRVGAVIYEDQPDAPFSFVERMKNPKGHALEGQLDSDRPGMMRSSGGGGTIHHGMDKTFHHHEQAAAHFAKAIAKKLLEKKREQKFTELIIAAEPHFLGLIRQELAPELKSLILYEVNREYLEGSDQEMCRAILKAIVKKNHKSPPSLR
jgi:protein required for attachment to host cells